MKDQIFRTMDDSIKVVKDSWSKDIAEIRSLLRELAENLATSKHTPVEFRRFSGEDPELWISQAERYFEFYGTLEKNKLLRASIYLEGEALDWFGWLLRNKQLKDWEHFVAKVRIRFRKQQLKSLEGHMATTKEYSTEIEAQVFDNMLQGCCCSKFFPTEQSDIGVLTDTTKSALENAKSEEVQVFDEGSPGNGNTHQSHSETLKTKVTIEVLVNQIGISSNSVPSLVCLTGYNCNGTKLLESKNKEEKNARENAAVLEISPLTDITSYQIPFARQGYVMSNAIGKFSGIAFPFSSVNKNILFHHHVVNLHKCNWVDTGQERRFHAFLLPVTHEPNMAENIQGLLRTFAKSYSKQSPNIQAHKAVRLSLARCGLVYKANSTSPNFSFVLRFGFFTTFVGAVGYYSVMDVDDFKQIVRILECHVDSISDLCFLNQFPFDPGVNLFMVTRNGRPLVVRLQPRTSIHTLLLVKLYTFRTFWVLSYIRRTIGIIHKEINHHNLLVDFRAPLVNLCDWEHAKALVERQLNIFHICSQYYRATNLIFGATKYTTAIGIWSTSSVLVGMNVNEEMVKLWPLMDLASLDYCAWSRLSEEQIVFDWIRCCCGGTENNMPSCNQNVLLPNCSISPCGNIKFQHAKTTDVYLLAQAQQHAMNLFVWDPGMRSKYIALTSYTVNIAALLLLGSTGKFYFIRYANSMTQVWDLGRKLGIHSSRLLTSFAFAVARCCADDFIIFILRSILDPSNRIIEFLHDSSLCEFAALHTCSLTMMENVFFLDDVKVDLMKIASIVVADVHRTMITEGKGTFILAGPNIRLGKFTTTGRLMCYFAYFGGCISIAEHSRDQQLLESNSVLELISNAKTVQTDNSSCCIFLKTRVGKSRRVSSAEKGALLLESSPKLLCLILEQKHHCFYLLYAVPAAMKKKCRLGDPESFDYLNQSYCYELVSVTGAHGSLGTKKVMEIVAFIVKEQEAIFRFMAYVLPLDNLELAKGTGIDSSILKVERHWSALDACSSHDRFTNIMLMWLYSNLEDKVLFEGESIVVNQDNSNNMYGPVIWTETIGPGAKLRRGPRIKNPNKRFVWDPGKEARDEVSKRGHRLGLED